MRTEAEIRQKIANDELMLRQNEEAERLGLEAEWDELALYDEIHTLRWVLNE